MNRLIAILGLCLLSFIIGYCGNFNRAVNNELHKEVKDSLKQIVDSVNWQKTSLRILENQRKDSAKKLNTLNKVIYTRQQELIDMYPNSHYP